MTGNENLLVTTMEECNELSMVISKALRFGIDEPHCETGVFNDYTIMKEYIQLVTMMNILIENGILEPLDESVQNDISTRKRDSVKKWQQHSKELGLINDSLESKNSNKTYAYAGYESHHNQIDTRQCLSCGNIIKREFKFCPHCEMNYL